MLDPYNPYFLTAPAGLDEDDVVLKQMLDYFSSNERSAEIGKVGHPILERMARNTERRRPLTEVENQIMNLMKIIIPMVGTPAHNDYHIARWTVLGEDADLLYLINKARELTGEQRTRGDRDNMGATTALWSIMIISRKGERFKADILRLAGEDGPWLTAPPAV